MTRVTMKASFKERFESVMRNIATAETFDQLDTCDKLKDTFLNQIENFENLNRVKDTIEGMIVLREYQLKNTK